MTEPKTFHGLNSEGQEIASCTARSATEYLDPNEVKQAIDNLVSVFEEEMNNIANALRDTTTDANEAIIVQGTKMTGTIEDTADSIAQIPAQVIDSFNELYEISVQRANELQEELNNAAYNSVASQSGVTSVVG